MQGMSGKQNIMEMLRIVVFCLLKSYGILQNLRAIYTPIASKPRPYHGRVGSGRTAGRWVGVGQDWVPTKLFA